MSLGEYKSPFTARGRSPRRGDYAGSLRCVPGSGALTLTFPLHTERQNSMKNTSTIATAALAFAAFASTAIANDTYTRLVGIWAFDARPGTVFELIVDSIDPDGTVHGGYCNLRPSHTWYTPFGRGEPGTPGTATVTDGELSFTYRDIRFGFSIDPADPTILNRTRKQGDDLAHNDFVAAETSQCAQDRLEMPAGLHPPTIQSPESGGASGTTITPTNSSSAASMPMAASTGCTAASATTKSTSVICTRAVGPAPTSPTQTDGASSSSTGRPATRSRWTEPTRTW